MAELVSSLQEIEENVRTLENFRNGTPLEKDFQATLIKRGKWFIAMQSEQGWLFAPSRFVGYKNNNIHHNDGESSPDGRVTSRRISKLLGKPLETGTPRYAGVESAFLAHCDSLNIEPHVLQRSYWILSSTEEYFHASEEVVESGFLEGTVLKVFVNKYERSIKARRECLLHHGYACSVCEFDFEKRYGSLGRQYIHVHHLVPIATIGKSYKVDPLKDLRPVCPNCHSMLHQDKTKTMTIEELRNILRN